MELNKENLEDFQKETNYLLNLKNELKENKRVFDDENRSLTEKIESYFQIMEADKNKLKEAAIKDFEETGEKKLLGGIGIRVGTSINYDDNLAFSWAKEHSLCLQLDRKEFEKLAKTQDINGVTKEEKVSVTFPKEIKL